MSPSARSCTLALLFLAMCVPAWAQRPSGRQNNNSRRVNANVSAPAPAASGTGLAAFKITAGRNIFDPDRRQMVEENAVASTGPAPIRSGFLNLTGTMVADGKRLAFFNGSQAEFNRVITISDQVAGCTVTGIETSHVDLKRGDKEIVLPVGRQLTLDDSLKVSAPAEGSAPAPDAASPSASPTSTPPRPSGGTPDRAEVMRRMMERRQKEESK